MDDVDRLYRALSRTINAQDVDVETVLDALICHLATAMAIFSGEFEEDTLQAAQQYLTKVYRIACAEPQDADTITLN